MHAKQGRMTACNIGTFFYQADWRNGIEHWYMDHDLTSTLQRQYGLASESAETAIAGTAAWPNSAAVSRQASAPAHMQQTAVAHCQQSLKTSQMYHQMRRTELFAAS